MILWMVAKSESSESPVDFVVNIPRISERFHHPKFVSAASAPLKAASVLRKIPGGSKKKTLAYFSHGGFCGIFHNAIWLYQLCGFLIPKTSKNHDFLHHVPINIHEPYGMLGSIFKPAEDDKFMSDINNMYERSTCNLGQKPVMKLVLIKPMICVS